MDDLRLRDTPELRGPAMILGFTGWMNGGNVSIGTVDHFVRQTKARRLAEIDPLEFYVLNFPVATLPTVGQSVEQTGLSGMEIAAIFRPHTEIEDGVVKRFVPETNVFRFSTDPELILFYGEEPHIRWRSYSDCVLEVARRFNVREIYFVGSVAGPGPHTREPRVRCSTAREEYKERFAGYDVSFTDYSGPASLVTYLTIRADEMGIPLRSIVVDVPMYPTVQMNVYPRSILRVVRLLSELLRLRTDTSSLEQAVESVREQIDKVVAGDPELRQLVDKMETVYDTEVGGDDEDLLRRLMEGMGPDGQPDERPPDEE